MQITKISRAVLYFIILLLGISTSQLVWKAVDLNFAVSDENQGFAAINPTPNKTNINHNYLNTIISSQVFAEAAATNTVMSLPIKQQKNVKQTKLNLRLTGLIKGNPSVAIIVYKGLQRSYLPGDFIVNSSRQKVQLDQVQHNYVTIINNGVQERLNLPKLKSTSSLTGISSAFKAPARSAELELDLRSAAIKALLGSQPRATIMANPLSLAKFIQISPSINKGKLKGYTIAAGFDNRLLKTAGLQAGDILTHIDGQAVTQLTIPAMFSLLETNNHLQITLSRQGSILTMDIKL